MSSLTFQNPQLLWLLLLLPVLALLKGRTGRPSSLIFSSVAIASQVSKNARSRAGAFLFFLRLLAAALLIVAVARPQLGRGFTEVESSGIDIVLVVDLSSSMAALDFSTDEKNLRTRLDVVKEVLEGFIAKRPSDRIGMVAFAVNPYLVSPLTLNHDWLLRNLERMELGLIDGSRTAIGTAIGTSVNRLRELPDAKSRVIVLLTDGENNAGNINPIAAAEAATAYRTKIYTIMAGKSGNVPYARLDQGGRVIRDRAGNLIFAGYGPSQSDDSQLKEIARMTDGKFYRAENKKDLSAIYNDIDRLEKTTAKLHQYSTYEELFLWPALLALLLLAIEFALSSTKLRRLP